MDPLTRSFLEKDTERLSKITAHLQKGSEHMMMVEYNEVNGDVTVTCVKSTDEVICNKLLHEPLPDDTCVVDGKEWSLTWNVEDTYRAQTQRDYSE